MVRFKIAFFDASLIIGGVEKVMIAYMNELSRLGYDISFIFCKNGKLGNLIDSSVNHECLNVSRIRYAVPNLVRLLKKNKYDYIFCANVQTSIVLLAKYLSSSKTKIITSHHYYINNAETTWKEKIGLRIIYNHCDKIIAISQGIMNELINNIGVQENKIYLLNNPIDIHDIKSKSLFSCETDLKEKSIVWLGRLSVVKNLPLLVNSFSNILSLYPYYHLYLVGDGPERINIEDLVSKKVLNTHVHFIESTDNPYPYINNAKIIALSSESEAYPTVLLESLALGKTIVSTPTMGAIEILGNGKLGYISKDHSVSSFTDALIHAINNPMDPRQLEEASLNSSVNILVNGLLGILNN